MKKKGSRITALMTTAAMTAGMLAGGCGNVLAEEAVDTSEFVTIKMILVGDPPEEVDEVYGKVNEILKEKVNAELDVEWMSWGDAGTKYSLLFSSGEDFDMIFTASGWGYLEQTVAMGGFLGMEEEFVQKYAPDIWESIPKMGWKQCTFDGKIGVIPSNFVEVTPDCLAIRGDWMEELGFEDITTWDELVAFYKACGESGKYAAQDGNLYWTWFQQMGYDVINGAPNAGELVLYNANDSADTELKYILEMDEFKEFCHQMKEMADAGAWPLDFLNSSADRYDGILSGRAGVMVWNAGSCQMYGDQANAEHPEWKFNVYNVMPGVKYTATKYINNAMGINAISKHPERTLMVLNEIQSNAEIQDLIKLGIEGVHWEAIGEDQFKKIGDGYNASNYWGLRNMNLTRKEYIENPTESQQKIEQLNQYFMDNVRTDVHPIDGFHFDNTNVSIQFAAVQAVCGTYAGSLMGGLVSDVDASLEEFKAALDSAGMQDILDEMQKQVNDYMAEQE